MFPQAITIAPGKRRESFVTNFLLGEDAHELLSDDSLSKLELVVFAQLRKYETIAVRLALSFLYVLKPFGLIRYMVLGSASLARGENRECAISQVKFEPVS